MEEIAAVEVAAEEAATRSRNEANSALIFALAGVAATPSRNDANSASISGLVGVGGIA